jgi:hypothetical protein
MEQLAEHKVGAAQRLCAKVGRMAGMEAAITPAETLKKGTFSRLG